MIESLFHNSDVDDEFEESFRRGIDNSYLIFTGQKTYPEILSDGDDSHFFFFDPDTQPTKEDVWDLIYIYEEYEEYEKCGELLNLIKVLK